MRYITSVFLALLQKWKCVRSFFLKIWTTSYRKLPPWEQIFGEELHYLEDMLCFPLLLISNFFFFLNVPLFFFCLCWVLWYLVPQHSFPCWSAFDFYQESAAVEVASIPKCGPQELKQISSESRYKKYFLKMCIDRIYMIDCSYV